MAYIDKINVGGTVYDVMDNTKSDILISVPASGWSNDAPYTQTISNSNIKSISAPIPLLDPTSASSKTEEDNLKKNFGYISYFDTGNGTITFTAKFTKPSVDLSINLKGV